MLLKYILYPMLVSPFVSVGASHRITTLLIATFIFTFWGFEGTFANLTESVVGSELPTIFTALISNWYTVPRTNPDTVVNVERSAIEVNKVESLYTWYLVRGIPPL